MKANKCIVVGTTSDNFAEWIVREIKERCRYQVVTVNTEWDLKSTMRKHRPYLVFIDSCAWQTATANMLDKLTLQYAETLFAVFSFESITLKEAGELVNCGARGMINIRFDNDAVTTGIKTLLGGNDYIPSIVRRAARSYERERDNLDDLTSREKEVYRLLLKGMPIGELSEKLAVSFHTAKNHRHHIYQKLGIKNISALMQYARSRGDLDPKDVITKHGRKKNREQRVFV
jgi:DNA-binding NarL/FixJ family response regulator